MTDITTPSSTSAGPGPLSSADVSRDRIEAITFAPMSDVLRNHLVTLAYVDLSNAMSEVLGREDANWCSLAVWPSLTVGATIRSGSTGRAIEMALRAPMPAPLRKRLEARLANDEPDVDGVMNRSLAAGNRGVFYEIGLAWTDFLSTFGATARSDDDWVRFEAFGERVMGQPLPPGRVWPDGAREHLRDGFRAYLEAMHSEDPRRRAQLILLGNMLIGDHEQRRLQGWLDLSALDSIRGITRTFDDDTTQNRGIALAERVFARFITKQVFYVEMNGERIRVGHEVPPHPTSDGALFPAPLDELEPDVAAVFDRIDGAARGGDGAERWTDIDHRMAFIATLFRSRQRSGLVGVDPYPEQLRARVLEQAAAVDRRDAQTNYEGALLFDDMTLDLRCPWDETVEQEFRASLESARRRGDDEADGAVAAFYRGDSRPPEERFYTDVLAAVARSKPEDRGPLATFLSAPPVLPAWADPEQIQRAQAFYADYRSAAHLGLFYGSMPLSYAASRGCQVLGLVSTLSGDTVRRFWESAKFLEDVFTTPFWEADSDGYAAIRGVRLFHAAVRSTIEAESRHIVHRPPHLEGRVWDHDWGRPINQEDYLGGTIDFSVAAIHVMDRFGVAMDPDDARAYMHTWLVVGAMLGVDEELLTSPADPTQPMSLEEAQFAARVILFRQIGPTIAGRRLMDGLLGLIDDWFPRPLRRIPRAMMYAAMNDELAHVLGLPPAGRTERAFLRLNEEGRSWRTNRLYQRGYRRSIDFVGDRWLAWWENEYQEVPPFRRGGHDAVEVRKPVTLHLTLEVYGEVQDLDLGGIDHLLVQHRAVEDDGFESAALTQIVEASSAVGSALRTAVVEMRELVRSAQGLRRAELLIDGRPVALSSLTDEEIDALFPD